MGIIATVLAAVLALAAVLQSKSQSKKSLDAIAKERRIDFELDVLKDLLLWVGRSGGDSDRRVHARMYLALLDPPSLPLCRARFGMATDPEDQRFRALLGPFPSESRMEEAQMADGRILRAHKLDEVGFEMKRRASERD